MKFNINNITCPNRNCKYYLKKNGKNIVKHGKNKAGHQRYYCKNCHKWFVETINTFLYHKHLSKSDIITIFSLIKSGNSIRSIEKNTGHHRDTIRNLIYKSTSEPENLNEFLTNNGQFEDKDIKKFWNAINDGKKKLSYEAKSYLMKKNYSDPRFK